jgi:hypothetical protein
MVAATESLMVAAMEFLMVDAMADAKEQQRPAVLAQLMSALQGCHLALLRE